MGIRGELWTNQVNLDNRSYYFNVKENRAGDVFLQIVESKIKVQLAKDVDLTNYPYGQYCLLLLEDDVLLKQYLYYCQLYYY